MEPVAWSTLGTTFGRCHNWVESLFKSTNHFMCLICATFSAISKPNQRNRRGQARKVRGGFLPRRNSMSYVPYNEKNSISLFLFLPLFFSFFSNIIYLASAARCSPTAAVYCSRAAFFLVRLNPSNHLGLASLQSLQPLQCETAKLVCTGVVVGPVSQLS